MPDNPAFLTAQDDIKDYGTGRERVTEGCQREKKSIFNTFRSWLINHLWIQEQRQVRQPLTLVIIVLMLWLLLFILLGNQISPSGDLFRLLVLILCATIAAPLTAFVRLPPLLGMLLAGIFLRSVGFYHISGIYPDIVANLRQTAMTVILLKAGLGLDPATLAKLFLVVGRLGVCPCSLEATSIALITHYFLGYPWLWALVLGFLLSAISPAVVVPTILDLKDRGYGEDKGIATLVLAACSLDDITSISMFSLFLGMIFSTGDVTQQVLQGPTDVVVGLLVGITWGFICGSLPHKDDPLVQWKRAVLVGLCGLCSVLGAAKAGFPSAGPLACVTLAFVSSICWNAQGPVDACCSYKVTDILSLLWRVLEPMLYAFIGAEIDVRVLDIPTISWGVATILGALVVRVLTCGVVLLGANLRWKEILFVAIAWLPKATVQAALAPLPLEMGKAHSLPPEDLDRARQILTVAVLSILLTSPLGAIGTSIAGPRLLKCKYTDR